MTPISLSGPSQNLLVQALPQAVLQRWLPLLEPVELALGQVLYESGGKLSHVYFPTSSIVSLLYVTELGSSAEIAVVGYEGIVGIALFMGGRPHPAGRLSRALAAGFACGPVPCLKSSRVMCTYSASSCATPRR